MFIMLLQNSHITSPTLVLFCLQPTINIYSICSPSPTTGIDFSRDGGYMALAERRDCKDYVSVFVCEDWHLLRVSGAGECGGKPKPPLARWRWLTLAAF